MFSGLIVTFTKDFAHSLGLIWPLLVCLAGIIALLSRVVGKNENWSWFDGIYWACITATTVGYGDIRPTKRSSRIIAVMVAITGLIMTGILVAVAVHAGSMALNAVEPAMKVN
jgi:voltage-gated potassium channel Kch